jgi:hypothetical protein
MEIEKINEIIKSYKDKPNKQLFEVLEILGDEFNKTKELIVNLTNHLEIVENEYNKINEEYNLRIKK